MTGIDELLPTSHVPLLFKDKPGVQEVFEEIGLALEQNPAIFRQAASARDISSRVNFVIGALYFQNYRGEDFMEEHLSGDAMDWLYSEDNERMRLLGTQKNKSKLGRLGTVVAMHPAS